MNNESIQVGNKAMHLNCIHHLRVFHFRCFNKMSVEVKKFGISENILKCNLNVCEVLLHSYDK